MARVTSGCGIISDITPSIVRPAHTTRWTGQPTPYFSAPAAPSNGRGCQAARSLRRGRQPHWLGPACESPVFTTTGSRGPKAWLMGYNRSSVLDLDRRCPMSLTVLSPRASRPTSPESSSLPVSEVIMPVHQLKGGMLMRFRIPVEGAHHQGWTGARRCRPVPIPRCHDRRSRRVSIGDPKAETGHRSPD